MWNVECRFTVITQNLHQRLCHYSAMLASAAASVVVKLEGAKQNGKDRDEARASMARAVLQHADRDTSVALKQLLRAMGDGDAAQASALAAAACQHLVRDAGSLEDLTPVDGVCAALRLPGEGAAGRRVSIRVAEALGRGGGTAASCTGPWLELDRAALAALAEPVAVIQRTASRERTVYFGGRLVPEQPGPSSQGDEQAHGRPAGTPPAPLLVQPNLCVCVGIVPDGGASSAHHPQLAGEFECVARVDLAAGALIPVAGEVLDKGQQAERRGFGFIPETFGRSVVVDPYVGCAASYVNDAYGPSCSARDSSSHQHARASAAQNVEMLTLYGRDCGTPYPFWRVTKPIAAGRPLWGDYGWRYWQDWRQRVGEYGDSAQLLCHRLCWQLAGMHQQCPIIIDGDDADEESEVQETEEGAGDAASRPGATLREGRKRKRVSPQGAAAGTSGGPSSGEGNSDGSRKQGATPHDKPHACPHCAAAFGWASHLTRHVRVVHEKRKDHACPHCAAAFSQASKLTTHVGTHHPENTQSDEFPVCMEKMTAATAATTS